MAGLIGLLLGGTIGVFVLQNILEWAIFKRIADDPVVGKLGSTAAAYVLAVIIYGFGSADGGAWRPDGLFNYAPGATIVGFFAYRRGMKLRELSGDQVADAFK